MTRWPTSSGWPYTAPSRPACQLMLSRPARPTPAATPVRAASRPKVGQAALGCAPCPAPGGSVLCDTAGPAAEPEEADEPAGADGPGPLHPPAATRTPTTAPANATLLRMLPVSQT